VLKLYESKESFADKVLPFVKMFNSKAYYAKERGHASNEFVEMIKQCVNQANDKETLETFKLFFEAVIGFAKIKEDRYETN
jgi:CRISPR-associated protein Csm2